VAAVLAGSGAVLAAAIAWLLAEALALPVTLAAGVGAALALLAAAVPTLAVALTQVRGASAPAEAAPVRDRDTGAFRRDVFLELAEREWARARRYGTGAGLLLIDVDRAARLAESHGPAAADAFLTTLARHTSPTLRGADLVTRLAPSQLAVFLAQADPTGALDVAERIRERAEALDLPWPDGKTDAGKATRVRATVSVGVAPLRPAHLNLQALIHDAEDAVAAARLAGGNCVRAAPVDAGVSQPPGSWRDDHRARPQ
jgi:diguanylate cyclase (GGDEF)-like protein